MQRYFIMAKEYNSRYKTWIRTFFSTHQNRRFNASAIQKVMKDAGFHINLVTVYRNLDRLVDEQVLSRQKTPEESENYYQYLNPELSCGQHLHLICKKCGRIIHLNCDFMEIFRSHLAASHGFSIDCRESMLVGLCDQCRADDPAENIPKMHANPGGNNCSGS